MRRLMHVQIISLLLLVVLSCSKSEEETVDPIYVGKWERIGFNEQKSRNFKQILEIEKTTFKSNVFIQEDDTFIPYVEYYGTQTVIDNTLEAWVSRIGVANLDNTYTFKDNTTPDYDNLVFEKLNIHSNFIGTYFIDNNTLTLRLDIDNDGSVSGNEGLFVFQLIEN